MPDMNFETENQRADTEIAKALAMSSAVEIKHRYRMSRIEAEQKTIQVRLRRNFWRSRTARNLNYTLCIAFGLGLGVLAHSQWLLYERASEGVAQAATQAQLVLGNQLSGVVGASVADATPAKKAKSAEAATLVVMDSIDVPFLRAKSILAKNGLTGVLDFVKVNDKAQKMQVTGVYGPTENPAIAAKRALFVVDVLMKAGLSRQAVEVMPVVPSKEDGKIISGARLSSMGPRLRAADSISKGAPLGPGAAVLPLPFNSAFSQGATVAPMRPPESKSELTAPSVQRQKLATDDEGEANVNELEKAVQLAASRRLMENAQPKQKPPPAKVASKPESGLETAQVTGNQDPKPATATKSNAFTVVSKLENAVLIRVGREVRHIQVGDSLPDGNVLGKNLEPMSPTH